MHFAWRYRLKFLLAISFWQLHFLSMAFFSLQFLIIHYEGCPKQERVKLHAEIHFPNLHFSLTTVDFGCVLNDTKSEREISITNNSSLPVSYCWDFLDEQKSSDIRFIYTQKYSHVVILVCVHCLQHTPHLTGG